MNSNQLEMNRSLELAYKALSIYLPLESSTTTGRILEKAGRCIFQAFRKPLKEIENELLINLEKVNYNDQEMFNKLKERLIKIGVKKEASLIKRIKELTDCHFQRLPKELQKLIMGHVDLEVRGKFSLTRKDISTSFERMALRFAHSNMKSKYLLVSEIPKQERFKIIEYVGELFTDISFFSWKIEFTPEELQRILKACPNLEKIRYLSCCKNILDELTKLPKLTHLHLDSYNECPTKELMSSAVTFSHLKSLRISSWSFGEDPSPFVGMFPNLNRFGWGGEGSEEEKKKWYEALTGKLYPEQMQWPV